jgi:hypothetical protein
LSKAKKVLWPPDTINVNKKNNQMFYLTLPGANFIPIHTENGMQP